MDDLTTLANSKIQAASHSLLERLRFDVEALHRRHIADGRAGGGTIAESQNLCVQSMKDLGNEIMRQYTWVTSESVFVSAALVDDLVREARAHLRTLRDESQAQLKLSTNRFSGSHLLAQFTAELDAARDRVWTDIDVSLRAILAQRQRRTARQFLATIPSMFSRIWKWFAGH